MKRSRHTEATPYTRRNTPGKTFVEALTASHFTEFFLLFSGELGTKGIRAPCATGGWGRDFKMHKP